VGTVGPAAALALGPLRPPGLGPTVVAGPALPHPPRRKSRPGRSGPQIRPGLPERPRGPSRPPLAGPARGRSQRQPGPGPPARLSLAVRGGLLGPNRADLGFAPPSDPPAVYPPGATRSGLEPTQSPAADFAGLHRAKSPVQSTQSAERAHRADLAQPNCPAKRAGIARAPVGKLPEPADPIPSRPRAQLTKSAEPTEFWRVTTCY
jgi:hypothetical protein